MTSHVVPDDVGFPVRSEIRAVLDTAEATVSREPAQARERLRAILDSGALDGDVEALGRAWRGLGLSFGHENQPLQAVEALERARNLLVDGGLTRASGVVTCDLATVLGNQLGRTSEAIELFEEALATAAECEDGGGEGRALGLLGSLLGRLDRFEEAERHLRRAVDLLGGAGDTRSALTAASNLGYLLLLRGRHAEARDVLAVAVADSGPLADSLDALPARLSLALSLAHLDRHDEASRLLHDCEELLDEARVYSRIDHAQTLGRARMLAGQPDEAVVALRSAVALAREAGQIAPEVECLRHLAEAAELSGDLRTALDVERELREAERRQLDERGAAQIRAVEATLALRAREQENRLLEAARRELAERVEDRTAALRAEVEERRHAEELAAHLATSDWLTDLPNRRAFEARLHRHLDVPGGHPRLGLCFVDLDRFKAVNDAYGHEAGDSVLRQAAARLRSLAPDQSMTARFGGDEFVLLVPADEASDVEDLARSIIDMLSQPMAVGRRTLESTCSVGVAVLPDDARDGGELLRRADLALRAAKHEGRNRWARLTAESWRGLERQARLQADLTDAWHRGEMSLVFQPQWRLRDGALTGVEALLRWQHPELGAVPPARFIPLAEESGQIGPLGRWVVCEALRSARRLDAWLPATADWTMAINVSVPQLHDVSFAAAVVQATQEADWPLDRVQFELTESVQLSRDCAVFDNIEALHERGLGFALDDFGSGYASFGHLQQLRFSTLKMDRSIVQEVADSVTSQSMSRAIVALAHALNMRVTAEGVETGEQLAVLAADGVDEGQGFFLARPLTESALVGIPPRLPGLVSPTRGRR